MSDLISDGHGNEFWILNNSLHREDGPALIYSNLYMDVFAGTDLKKEHWFIYGNNKTREILEWITDIQINPNWREWSHADKVLFKLRFV